MKKLMFSLAAVLTVALFSACGGSSNGTEAEFQKETLPTDGILGELPKAVFPPDMCLVFHISLSELRPFCVAKKRSDR